jgi:pantoate--beta-alanine ligase
MRIVSSIRDMQRIADDARGSGTRIGLVPTMGFLHPGHMSLLDAIRNDCGLLVLSIFVNPTQFGPTEDFDRYPRDLERDLAMAREHGADIVFTPAAEDMYPPRHQTSVLVEGVSAPLEGEFRPGHFRGVATIVAKFFNIVKPHIAVFGQKDAQQAAVLRRMTSDLNFDVDIVIAPIVREPDGLAMSSRNTYLRPEDRTEARAIYRGLMLAASAVAAGQDAPAAVRALALEEITRTGAIVVEYLRVVDAETFEDVGDILPGARVLIATAVRIGATRLIDNMILQG